MISKAKLLFYGAYKSGKPPNDGLIPLNFIRKLMLLRVRRFQSYSEIPDRISHYDWHQACIRAHRQRRIFFIALCIYVTCDVALFMRRRLEKRADLAIAERKAKNIPLVPRMDVFGENEYWARDNIDYWIKKKKKREAEEQKKLLETDGKTP